MLIRTHVVVVMSTLVIKTPLEVTVVIIEVVAGVTQTVYILFEV